jgi:uncharacterized protein YbaP (TraB family)
MYFEIEGSSVRLGGTMHWVPKGRPLAHWVHDAIGWARLIYLEHDKEESDRGRYAPSGSQRLAQRLPHSWPRIERKYPFDRVRVEHLSTLRPFAVASELLDPAPFDPGVERLAIARSNETQPPGPRIDYLETAAQSYALADGVSNAVWDDAVSWALDNSASFKRVLESSYRAWVAGDFEEVDRISTLYSPNRFAPIKRAVITSRNCLWLPTIRELVQSANEPTLILVGAAHLGGSDGLLPQLAAGGLTLKQPL